MIKPDLLRAAITAMFPGIDRDPERFALFVDKGRILSTQGPSRAFQWSYTLSLWIFDFSGEPSVLFLTINDWLRVQQPELLGPGTSSGFLFEAEILGTGSYDLNVQLDLTETVVLRPRVDGGFDLEHLAEPDTFLPDDLPLSTPPALLRQIWKDGVLICPPDPTA